MFKERKRFKDARNSSSSLANYMVLGNNNDVDSSRYEDGRGMEKTIGIRCDRASQCKTGGNASIFW